MAITCSLLKVYSNTGPGSSVSVGTITPDGSKPLFLGVHLQENDSQPANPAISGLSLSWTLIDSVLYDGSKRKLFLYKGIGSATSGNITIGSLVDMSTVQAIVVEVGESNKNDPVVQSDTNSGDVSRIGATLSTFAKDGNATLGFFGNESGSSVDMDPDSPMVEVGATGFAEGIASYMAFFNDEDTAPSYERDTGSGSCGVIAIEVAQKPSGRNFYTII